MNEGVYYIEEDWGLNIDSEVVGPKDEGWLE